GTAQLAGSNLPPDRALAAFNWIDRAARAAKAAGDRRTLDQLRADAMLDRLSGRPFCLDLYPAMEPVPAAADQAARGGGRTNESPDDLTRPYRPSRPVSRPGYLKPRSRKQPHVPGRGVVAPGTRNTARTANGPTGPAAAARGANAAAARGA